MSDRRESPRLLSKKRDLQTDLDCEAEENQTTNTDADILGGLGYAMCDSVASDRRDDVVLDKEDNG